MSAPENPFAYPLAMTSESVDNPGMTLRDHFAGQALIGQLAFSPRDEFDKVHMPDDVAALAYRFADAMLAERQKGGA